MSICSSYLNCNPENQEEYARDGKLAFVKCNDCGIIWRSDSSSGMLKDYNETYFESKNYEKNRQHKIRKSKRLIAIAARFNHNIGSLLEVGCSVGNTLEAARKLGISHLGIDISQFAVDYCRNRGLNAERKSLEQLMEEENSFDLMYMQHVLEHFPDLFDILGKCRNLLSINGLILILVPNSSYRRATKRREKHRFYSIRGVGTEHFAYFNYKNLTNVLNSSGFEVVQTNYPFSVRKGDSLLFFINRLYRRTLTLFNGDQEILVIARKSKNV